MKKILTIVTLLSVISIAGYTYASNQKSNGIHEQGTGLEKPELKEVNKGTGQGLNTTSSTEAPTINPTGEKAQDKIQNKLQDGTGVENQNQNKIMNQGDSDKIKNKEKEDDDTTKSNVSARAQERRSAVANAVQELLSIADRNGGIGQQIKLIAQAQNDEQEKLEEEISNVQSRSGFAKFFIGPKYSEINKAEKLLSQNQEKIAELNQLKEQIKSTADQQSLVEQITLLEQANTELQTTLNSEKEGFSLFGWLFK